MDDATVKAPRERRDSVPLLKPTRLRLRVKSTPLRVKSTLLKLAALSARRALAARDRTPMLHRILPCRSSPRSAPPSIVVASYRLRPEPCRLFPGARDDEAARECAWDHRGLETVTCQPAAGQAASGQVVPCPGALPENRADDVVKLAQLAQLA